MTLDIAAFAPPAVHHLAFMDGGDPAGNVGSARSTAYALDNTPPTAGLSSNTPALLSGEIATITLSFSEPVQGLVLGGLSATGGTLSNLVASADPLVYTVEFTPSGGLSGVQSIVSLAAGSYTDMAGNNGAGANSLPITINTLGPSVLITSDAAALKAGESAHITFTFSSVPSGFAASDIVVSGGALSGLANQGGGVYTALFTPGANVSAAASIRVTSGSYSDTLGNPGGGGATPVIAVDTRAPTLQISSSMTVLNSADTPLITFTFSEAPVGFSAGGISASGGALTGFASTANPLVYTAVFIPTPGQASGTGVVSVAAGAYADTAGNSGQGAAGPAISYATVLPGVAISSDVSALKAGQPPANITFKFSTPPFGFNFGDLVVGGGTLSGLAATADPLVYTAQFTPTAGIGQGTATISIASGTYADGQGNVGTGGSMPPISIDVVVPTVAITSNVPTANGVTPATITFTFSEAPAGFDASDITVGGGTLTSLVGTSDPKVYIATFEPTPGVASGSATIVVSGNYTDAAGNAGTGGAIPSLQIDTVAPTATAGGVQFNNDSGTAGDLITNSPNQTLSGNLSAPLAAGDGVQVSLDNGTTWTTASTSVGDTSWTLAGQTLSGSSTLQVRVTDAAGNVSTPYSAQYTIDTQAPTVAISSSISGAVGPGQSTTLTFTLSDPGLLTLADITVTGGTLTHFSGSGTTYTATLTPPANSSVPITVSVAGNLFTDAAGNANAAATPLVQTVNTNPPASGPDTPAPVPSTVDGMDITTATGPDGSTTITVPVVPPNRTDTPGTSTPLADIPLGTASGGHSSLVVSLPIGTGLQAEGPSPLLSNSQALLDLIRRIESKTGAGSSTQTELTGEGTAFLASLGANTPLTTRIVTPTTGTGFDPSVPLVITGSSNPADGAQAVILDTSKLPPGTTVQVDHVDFLVVAGSANVIGGAGRNTAVGDGAAQSIVLGPENDTIHGGGGNDTIGSLGGDDQLYGDAGDDIVFGGEGNDILSGGTGSDRLNGGTGFDVALQEGKKTDYTVTLDGAGIKLTHIASGVSDWLVDVEQVRFETGPLLTVAHSAAEEAAAFLFQKWVGRDLSQAEGAVIQTLTGKTALEVATLFAQVFPQQSAGKTPAQLLEGMAAAGAIRVDAVRDVTVTGDAGHNTITPTLGLARHVDGGAGIDTVVIPATLAQTHIQANGSGTFTLQRMTDGAMLDLTSMERINLNDTKLALDLAGHAGEAAKLLGALGGPAILSNKALVGEVIRALDAGASAQSLAGIGLQALGAQTPAQVAQLLWTNVVGRAGTQAELKPLVDLMGQGVTGSELAVLAGNLDLNALRIDLVGLAAKGIEFA